jgi:hypothetical protein
MGYSELLAQTRARVREWMPWDLLERLQAAEQPLVGGDGEAIGPDAAEALLAPRLRAEQRRPKR